MEIILNKGLDCHVRIEGIHIRLGHGDLIRMSRKGRLLGSGGAHTRCS